MSSRSGRWSPSIASVMIARSVSLISCFTGAVVSSADDIAVSVARITSGWRSSARDARRNTSADALCRCRTAWRPLIETVAQRRRLLGQRREEQLVLRRVVPVQRSERDLGPRRDIAHLHCFVATLGRQFGGRQEQPALARGCLGGARPAGRGCAPRARRRLDSTPQSPCDRSAVLERVAATPGWRSSCCDRRSGPRRPRRRTRGGRRGSRRSRRVARAHCRVQRIGRALPIEEPAVLLQARRRARRRRRASSAAAIVTTCASGSPSTRRPGTDSHAGDHLARGIDGDLREPPVAVDAEAVHHGPCGRHREPRAGALHVR